MTTLAERIVNALDGRHTEAIEGHGHWLLSARLWQKHGKSRVYLDCRYVNSDGRLDTRVGGNGYIEILSSGDIVYAVRNEGNEIRRIVEGL